MNMLNHLNAQKTEAVNSPFALSLPVISGIRRLRSLGLATLAICAFVLYASAGAGEIKAAAAPDEEKELTEAEKIELLITRVANSGGVFVRNGSEHSASAAAAHMRMKYSRAGGLIKTARNFIQHIATKSSITGRPYLIRFPDGREYKSAEWLQARLAEIESATAEECCSLKR
ncbi:MAG: DUF5329 domain-containing protein [bacterium]|nr:DUF5329 domain-containing protein [bacterium]